MQIKKGHIQDRIIESARSSFLEKGFEKASLRGIAEAAGTTKGNFYNYFRDKDELFCRIVEPAVTLIEESMMERSAEEHLLYFCRTDDKAETLSIESFLGFIKELQRHSVEMRLLLYSASGSSMENFRESVFKMYTESSFNFYEKIAGIAPEMNKKVSVMFVHSLAAMYLSCIEEVIVHKPDSDELEEYALQMAVFVHYGVKRVLRS